MYLKLSIACEAKPVDDDWVVELVLPLLVLVLDVLALHELTDNDLMELQVLVSSAF